MLINDVEVSFGPLKWGSYIKLKDVVQRTLSGKLIRVVFDFFASDAGKALFEAFQSGESTNDSLPAQLPKLKEFFEQHFHEVVQELMQTSEEFAQIIVEGCLQTTVQFDELSAKDALTLRAECIKHAEFAELMALEKNWWVGLASQAGKMFGTNQSSDPDPASIGSVN